MQTLLLLLTPPIHSGTPTKAVHTESVVGTVNDRNETEVIGNADDDGWQSVGAKRAARSSTPSDGSPSPINTFKNLRNIDEVDVKHGVGGLMEKSLRLSNLSRSQLKKLKRSKGLSSPPSS